MPGYSLAMLKINDPEVVATSGKTHHPVVTYTGNPGDRHVIRIMGFAKAMLAMKLAGA
ncbi:hypothetical protein [Paraburkholderia lycopersici]|uniref:Uncharacterized protein n=1 Tax=Paraburkholderia lycopersici TaxID=416944 RepID=A0A1G7C817_9BURK|nr:hypothetical protein SAMN05421548_14336 [Paraburkholderia lycopersici]